MKTFMQWALITWFVIFSAIVFLPVLKLLFGKSASTVSQPPNIPEPPSRPKAFAIVIPNTALKSSEDQKKYIEILDTKVKAFEKEVSVYESDVKAYSSQIEALKAYNTTITSTSLKDIYTTIVNDKLLNILTNLVTAFIAYVFVKGGTNLYFNSKAAATAQPLEHFSFF